MTLEFRLPDFYITPGHQCSYLPAKLATTLYVDPQAPKSNRLYTHLSKFGFRRSGEHLYAPYCNHCQACVPVRIPVHEFSINRNQARTWKQNEDLEVIPVEAGFRREEYALYCHYLASRHPGSSMCDPSPDDYLSFLTSSWSETVFYRISVDNKLIAMAVIDRLEDSLSSVYTFFDPESERRSPGKYAILLAIEEARILGLKWVYLGYWIEKCSKMAYKNQYKPMEYYYNRQWSTVAP